MYLIVSNMECSNCVAKIQRTLLTNGIFAAFDLKDRKISFNSRDDVEKAKPLIIELGYTISNA